MNMALIVKEYGPDSEGTSCPDSEEIWP